MKEKKRIGRWFTDGSGNIKNKEVEYIKGEPVANLNGKFTEDDLYVLSWWMRNFV